MNTEKDCGGCLFWREIGDEAGEFGECRRYPPQAVMDLALPESWSGVTSGQKNEYLRREVVWPVMHFEGWCGEHKDNEAGDNK